MDHSSANLEAARRYLKALEAGDPAAAVDLFAPDIVQVEYPNLLKPNGDKRDRAAMTADSRKGLEILSSQSYEIRNALAIGDCVALEIFWRGTLAIELKGLKPGDEMTAYSAIFLQFREGKIIAQRNYDCFPPFGAR
jgi:ketosteroid isomerase-like protein